MRSGDDHRRVVANALSLLGAYVVPRLFTVGAVVFAARALGTQAFGTYGAAAAYAVILSLLATLGMQPLLVRDLARDPATAPRVLRAAHRVKTAANVVMLAVLWGLAGPLGGLDPQARVAALWLGVAYAVGAYGENMAAYFQAVERMHVWTEASALAGILTGGLGALAIWLTSSVIWFCAASVVGQVAALGWMLHRAPAELRGGGAARGEDVLRLARATIPFAAAYVALSLFYKVDVILIQHLRSEHDVGLYSAAYKFVDLYQALVIVGIGALYPRLVRAAPRGDAERGRRWGGTRVTEAAVLAAMPVAGVLHLTAAFAIGTLFGADYGPAARALSWLALGLPALAVNLLGGYLLGATARIGWMALAYGVGLALKVSLDLLLVPRMGVEGAAIGMMAAELILAGGVLVALRVHAHVVPRGGAVAGAAGALALALAARSVSDPTGGVLVSLGLVAAILALYAALGLLPLRSARSRAIGGRAVAEVP